MSITHRYAITGANVGLGFESARQLASLHDDDNGNSTIVIYMLCRNETNAQAAITTLSREYPRVSFQYVHFDSSDRESVKSSIQSLSRALITSENSILKGLILNAGGFTSDRIGSPLTSGATLIAETNLIGHALLLNGLIEFNHLRRGSRIIFSGSEAGLGQPSAIPWENTMQYYVNILNGSIYKKYNPGDAYGHIKGMMAFYTTAMARRHPDLYFVAISPGSTRNTLLMEQGQFSPVMIFFIRGYIKMAGQHDVSVGAKRYIDGLSENYEYASGSFVCSRNGFIGDVCSAVELKKGRAFGDEKKQDLVYGAVEHFLKDR